MSQLIAERAAAVAAHPPSAAQALLVSGDEHFILGSSTCTLENHTGRGVRFWLGHEQHEGLDAAWDEGKYMYRSRVVHAFTPQHS